MTKGTRIIGAGIAAAVLLVATALFAFVSTFSDQHPTASVQSKLPSPDGKWIATLESVDNGLGFGQGMIYDEVHISRPNETITSHGDGVESVAFYIDAAERPGKEPYLAWRDATHLIIGYDKKTSTTHRPGKCLSKLNSVSVEYQPDCSR